MIVGLGHAPLKMLAFWKEGLLGIILLLALFEWFTSRKQHKETRWWAIDEIDFLIVSLVILSIIVTAFTHGDWHQYLFGFKYDFIPLGAFVVLRRVQWSDLFIRRVRRSLLFIGGCVAAYGLLTLYLPLKFFVWLGYSDLHSLYRPDAPLAAYQQIEGLQLRRIQSTFSGPNQFGLWLLIPWSIGLITMLTCSKTLKTVLRFINIHAGKEYCLSVFYMTLLSVSIILTFSRSAWLAALIIFIVAMRQLQSRDEFRRSFIRLGGLVIELLLLLAFLSPGSLLRLSSSREHLVRPLAAIQTIVEHPFGFGLGTAGPASNRLGDACVYFEEGADVSWAYDRPDLCVFAGDVQVQPVDRICRCPLLPENWYLQIGLEMGLIGLVIFAVIIIFVLYSLKRWNGPKWVFLSFLGIAFAALFLHAWEASAVAYTVWILAALKPLWRTDD